MAAVNNNDAAPQTASAPAIEIRSSTNAGGLTHVKRYALRDVNAPAAARVKTQSGDRYQLRLFVTGMTPRSARAVRNIREICEEHLPGRYELEVIDIYQHPDQARTEQIVVTPTLVKYLPIPVRKLIGDLSDKERVLAGLDITPCELLTSLSKSEI